jgi:hypothetical protein
MSSTALTKDFSHFSRVSNGFGAGLRHLSLGDRDSLPTNEMVKH